MKFYELLLIADRLLGPNGCTWDKEQTLFSLQPYLLEEMYELLEAIDSQDSEKIADELGDVLYALIFIAKLGELKKLFSIETSIEMVSQKLIRRHPHVFGDVKVSSNQEIIDNWEKIKQQEKTHAGRKSLFEGIPETLPALPRAQKMARKLNKQKRVECQKETLTEELLGERLWNLISLAEQQGIDAESALRRYLKTESIQLNS